MAREEKVFKISGLHTYADVFSAVPEGSLSTAENIVIDQSNIASPRRGYTKLPLESGPGLLEADINFTGAETLFAFKEKVHYQKSTGELYYFDDDKQWWVEYSDAILKPTGANRSRAAVSNQNVYLTSSNGVQKISALGSSLLDAGAPQALAASGTTTTSGATLLSDDEAVAYRILWGYKDDNSNLILGAPSQRLVIVSPSSGGPHDPVLTIPIPDGIDTTWFYQVYRSATVASTVTPSDELQLAYESNPTAGEISAQSISHTDTQPVDLLGTPLYTNDTQEGLVNSNYEPPQCVDMTLFSGHLFYANTKQKNELIIQLVGTGANGLQDGDTITIDGTVYTAKTTPVGSEDFQLTSGISPSQDVEDTAKALIDVINTNASSDILAYYWSEVGTNAFELPGEIRLVEKDFELAGEFTVSATGTNVKDTWTPDLSGAGQTSEAETKTNRIYYSKFQEPEAVPLANFFDVGPANSEIKRILPLRTSLLIFTQNEIYRLTGTTQAAFQLNLLDNTAKLVAEDSAIVFNNAVYGLFDQGVCSVSEAVQVLSRPIEGELLEIRGTVGSAVNNLTYGLGYESDRKFILYTPTSAEDTRATKAYVYNTVTRSWTTWEKPSIHGILNEFDDKIYLLDTDRILEERKNFSETDIADEAIDATVSSVSGMDLVIDPVSRAATEVGYYFFVSNTKLSRVSAINEATNTITLQEDLGWDTSTVVKTGDTTISTAVISNISNPEDIKLGATVTGMGIPTDTKVIAIGASSVTLNRDATASNTGESFTFTQTYDILPHISVEMTWNPFYMGSPGILKQFSEATLITTSALESVDLGFKGVTSGSFEEITFSEEVLGAWGLFTWGNVAWGGDPQVFRYRTYIPVQKQRDSAIFMRAKLNTIFNNFEISGASIVYRPIGSRTRR